MEAGHRSVAPSPPAWLAGLVPLVVLAAAIGLFVALDAPGLDRIGVPAGGAGRRAHRAAAGRDRAARAQRRRRPGRRSGRRSSTTASPRSRQTKDEIGRLGGAKVTVQYPWIEGEAYEVLLLTATGATIDHAIDAAVETPDADLGFYGLMALIGLYVGVIPVAIGMLWLPWLRSVDARWMRFLLAFTVGLLGFLGIEALLEGTEIAGDGARGARRRRARLARRGRRLPGAGRRGRLAARARAARTTPARARAAHARSASAPPSWSRSGSASTTSARGSRSARPTRSGRWRSAPRWSSASRSTTPPRGSRSSRRSRAPGTAAAAHAASCSGCSPARPPCSAPGSAPRRSTRASPALMFGIGAGAIAQVIVQIAPAIRGDDGPAAQPAHGRRPADRPAS